MQRRVYARECGEESHGLDRIVSARWTYLAWERARGYDVKYCEQARFIDIDRTSGSLILCGGSTSRAYGDPSSAAVGVFRYIEKNQRATQDHLSHYIHVKPAPIEFIRGQWHPHSQACFVTGSNDYAEVMVWDTERFYPVTAFDLDDDDAVLAAVMSSAPGAESGLVAIGTFNCKHVWLAAMEMGTAVHRMRLPVSGVAGINDIAWSPVSPHLIACVDTEGGAFLFDIRKSGFSACLLQFDESRRLPKFDYDPSIQMRSRRVVPDELQSSYRIERPNPLGLGCAWNDRLLYSLNEMGEFNETITTRKRPKSQMGRIRFTPDGSTAITADVNGQIRAWDIFTGHLLRTYYNIATDGSNVNTWYQGFCTPFEVSRDGSYILCTPHKGDRRGSLLTLDSEGCEISCAKGPTPSDDVTGMQDLRLHPKQEEVYSIPLDYDCNQITCWSPKRNDQPELATID